jgi:hypothetical protein
MADGMTEGPLQVHENQDGTDQAKEIDYIPRPSDPEEQPEGFIEKAISNQEGFIEKGKKKERKKERNHNDPFPSVKEFKIVAPGETQAE